MMFSVAFIFAIKLAIDSDKPRKICTGNYVNVLMQLGLIKKGLSGFHAIMNVEVSDSIKNKS